MLISLEQRASFGPCLLLMTVNVHSSFSCETLTVKLYYYHKTIMALKKYLLDFELNTDNMQHFCPKEVLQIANMHTPLHVNVL